MVHCVVISPCSNNTNWSVLNCLAVTSSVGVKDTQSKAKDLTLKAKANDLTLKAKARDLTLKIKPKAKDVIHT